jgi:hypothetical protein
MSAAAAIPFDWQRPDYLPVIRHRVESLQRIRQNPGLLPTMRQYYADHPATFIADWGSCCSRSRLNALTGSWRAGGRASPA